MNNSRYILVTGAAGYIGSVVTEQLVTQGFSVIAVDDLSQGHRQALSSGVILVRGNFGDVKLLEGVFTNYPIFAVVHLAAHSIVSESMISPREYFYNNVDCGLNLLDTMLKYRVSRIVFSSSAAVYGTPKSRLVTEEADLSPVNPYGETKIIFERILKWYAHAYNIDSISLRYFNAAGASPYHGEQHHPETHLIPNVLKVALGQTPYVSIFGTDYDTKDGTCIRDYIHVIDIAFAHVKALSIIDGIGAKTFNLGNERGYSVLEVTKMAEKLTGVRLPVVNKPRRPGDPPVLVASSSLAKKELGWSPSCSDLASILESAWQWQSRFPSGYQE